jgi:hypothetical protein
MGAYDGKKGVLDFDRASGELSRGLMVFEK